MCLCKKTLIDKLERISTSFSRKVFIRSLGFTYRSIPRSVIRRKMLNLDSLLMRMRRNDLLMAYKMLNGMVGMNVSEFFRLALPPRV